MRIINKARQIGISLTVAGEMLYRASTQYGYNANIVSTDKDEAAGKINYAISLYDSIPDELKSMGFKPTIWNRTGEKLAFHEPRYGLSTIISRSGGGVRGGRKDIYLDEAAFIENADSVYRAALPATIRGGGRMTLISTPFGQSGIFHSIFTDTQQYEDYSRHLIPWWESSIMVKPEYFEEALVECPLMDTTSRVMKYGTPELMKIWKNSPDIMSFQTEMECMFIDEAEAYYPIDLILRGTKWDDNPNWDDKPWYEIPDGWRTPNDVTIGVDWAKMRDQSVFTVVEHIAEKDGEPARAVVRFVKSSNEPYSEQIKYVRELVYKVRPNRITVDATGPGVPLLEGLDGLPTVVEGVTFTQKSKEQWATKFKGDLQADYIKYPYIPELVGQIHGIRRKKTENNLYRFSGDHDDYFWSLMLALYGEGGSDPRITFLGRP